MKKIIVAILIIFAISGSTLYAGEIGEIDIHGFISQGYLKSTDNNYFAETKDGTFQFNEMGINFATWVSPDLSIGVQFFASDLGDLGNDEIKIDWAYADYRWKPYLGIRAGKIKTPLCLYNETRDIDPLRTSIFLPTSIYPETARATMSSIKGIGFYGTLPFYLSYQFLMGTQEIDLDSGLGRMLQQFPPAFLNIEITALEVKRKHSGSLLFENFNLKVKLSYDYTDMDTMMTMNGSPAPDDHTKLLMMYFATEYTFNDLVFSFEYGQHRNKRAGEETVYNEMGTIGGSDKVTDWFELGFYYSWMFADKDDRSGRERPYNPLYTAWLKDTCVSAKFDINMNWSAKLEWHYFDGAAAMLDYLNPDYEQYWYMYAVKLSYLF